VLQSVEADAAGHDGDDYSDYEGDGDASYA
jgi:hypothetical protein